MRLEAQSKLGYYPTPPEMVELIKTYLKFPSGRFFALDPCCGEGIALELLVSGTNCKTYGVELDKFRAQLAKDRLDEVINDAIENVAITEGRFSLLFLNPPYDWDESGERKEAIFLAETTKYLMPGGILLFIIPCIRIGEIWSVLTTNFENLTRLDFTEEYRKAYDQIVIFATKKGIPSWDRSQTFLNYGVLGDDIEFKYNVPKATGRITTFSSLDMSGIKSGFSDAVWDRFYKMVEDTKVTSTAPLLPLREGHISLLLACGYLDGQVGGHVAKGTVIGDIISETEGNKIKEKKILKACVKILDRTGEIKTLS